MTEKNCLNCNKKLEKRSSIKYCSFKCQHENRYNSYIEQWKMGLEKGYKGKTLQISNFVKKYLFKKYNSKCSKCGWNLIHDITKISPLEVNHIDGDASNCKEDNLELLCPNCHSLTYNYKGLNKNSKRVRV